MVGGCTEQLTIKHLLEGSVPGWEAELCLPRAGRTVTGHAPARRWCICGAAPACWRVVRGQQSEARGDQHDVAGIPMKASFRKRTACPPRACLEMGPLVQVGLGKCRGARGWESACSFIEE